MVDESFENGSSSDGENPVVWLIVVALKLGAQKLTEFILDALDL